MSNPRMIDDYRVQWFLLGAPAVLLLAHDALTKVKFDYFGVTGRISCWLLVVALAVTPLQMMFGPKPLVNWLRRARRYIGVASFGYALVHLAYWLKAATIATFLKSFVRIEVLPGWPAFFILAVLAWASRDVLVARMGTAWKTLQRWVYPAAALTLIHWVLTAFEYRPVEILAFSVPLALMELWRWTRSRSRSV